MPKKRKSGLPYRKIKIKGGKTGYISKITGKRIAKKRISKNWRQQAVNELFPGKPVEVLKRTKRTFDEYRRLEMNLIDSSPDIERYLKWLKKHDMKGRLRLLKEFGGVGEFRTGADLPSRSLARRPKGKKQKPKRS